MAKFYPANFSPHTSIATVIAVGTKVTAVVAIDHQLDNIGPDGQKRKASLIL